MASAIGVTDHARVLWAVYKVLVVWFKEFLALYRSDYTLI